MNWPASRSALTRITSYITYIYIYSPAGNNKNNGLTCTGSSQKRSAAGEREIRQNTNHETKRPTESTEGTKAQHSTAQHTTTRKKTQLNTKEKHNSTCLIINTVFAENVVGFGFLWSVSYIKVSPNPRKIICCGKKWPKCYSLT